MRNSARLLAVYLLVAWLPSTTIADTVTVPFGTTVFCELAERVTSKKKETSQGDVLRAHVWRDVRVDGEIVIKAGTPVFVQVSNVKKAKMAGRKGAIELEALNVVAVDGNDVSLTGGYDRSGRGRMGLSIALAAVVAWPLIFLKGKNAVLEEGTIFDAMVRNPAQVSVAAGATPHPIKVAAESLTVEVLYDEMDPDSKITRLPLRLASSSLINSAAITAVNGDGITALEIDLDEGGLAEVKGTVPFKALSKHFKRGMNRFDVTVGELVTEVLLEIEL